jgi:hypothetical protein
MPTFKNLMAGHLNPFHIQPADWKLCLDLAKQQKKLKSDDCEAYTTFEWFEEDYSVKIHLGIVYLMQHDERFLDYDVYLLLRAAGFTDKFAELIVAARREGLNYLVIGNDADLSSDLPIYDELYK